MTGAPKLRLGACPRATHGQGNSSYCKVGERLRVGPGSGLRQGALARRNAARLAAGLAPRYSRLALDDVQLAPAREALSRLLNAPGAAPALVIDAEWNLLMANAGDARPPCST